MAKLSDTLSVRAKRRLKRWRRSLWETMRSDRYSRPSLDGLDRKLEHYLDFDGGFFVEAGANDGFTQSNTYYFEKLRRWRGLLIEPIPELAAECRRNRRGPVIEAALVSREESGSMVEIHFAGLMSTVSGALGEASQETSHVQEGLAVQQLSSSYSLRVPARALSSIFDEVGVDDRIDLLSLDVEGAESVALAGLDFERHAPHFVCIEVRNLHDVEVRLGDWYEMVEVLSDKGSYRDILFRLR